MAAATNGFNMPDPYATMMLMKEYAWHARDYDRKPAMARRLLQEALTIAESDSTGFQDNIRQLKRDIAELDYQLDVNEDALRRLVEVGDGFRAGDILLQQGKYQEALEVYEEFHAHGRFKNFWRLWRCSFLLNRFQDALQYLEEQSIEAPQRLVTDFEARAIAVAAFMTYDHLSAPPSWTAFVAKYPLCAKILTTKIGDQTAIILVADRWCRGVELEKLRKRVLGRQAQNKPQPSEPVDLDEMNKILDKARRGINDIKYTETPTATSVLKGLASSNKPLKGRTVVDHMCKGFIHALILDSHKAALAKLIDAKLVEFAESRGKDLVTFYRDTILGGFGFYEVNEVSKAIKTIVLECEALVRKSNGLPQRGEGWLAESEMFRLLTEKFAPHEVLGQYSPEWLQGLRFDSFIPDFNVAVEYQGEQHYRPVSVFGGKEGFAQTVKRDRLKLALAAQNGVTVEFISHEQDVDQETTRISKKYLS
jgi:tetratricopeptide (TPR) repeat protein